MYIYLEVTSVSHVTTRTAQTTVHVIGMYHTANMVVTLQSTAYIILIIYGYIDAKLVNIPYMLLPYMNHKQICLPNFT